MSWKINFILPVVCCLLLHSHSTAQYKAAPLPVKSSTFADQVKALRAAKPAASAAELAAGANSILDASGINFAIVLDAGTCDRIRKAKEQQKDPKAPLTIGATLKSVDAEGASLALPEPRFPASDCNCYMELPLLQITDVDFITVISGRNIRFHRPANFDSFDAVLIDPKDPAKAKRRWRIPFRGSPIGVSHDENVLYLAFPEPELNDLSLAIFGEGVFQIATRAEAEEGGKGKPVTIATTLSGENRIQFDRWGKSLVVSYKPQCNLTPPIRNVVDIPR